MLFERKPRLGSEQINQLADAHVAIEFIQLS
jgi:hypothetical protein